MAKSLQEQLLGAGLVDKKRAQKIKTEKRKKAKQQPKGHKQEDEAKVLAKKALEEKAARDRALNQQQKQQAEQKAIVAQIKQLIEVNKLDRSNGELAYQFTEGSKVKQLMVTKEQKEQIAKGQIAITKFSDSYELVPSKVAEKIAERNEDYVVVKFDKSKTEIDEDDPYAEYQIPDDLMW